MSNTQTLERDRHETGLSDSTHSSNSSSAERYRLDEMDGRPILLYKYRGGLQKSSQKDLCSWLDKGEVSQEHGEGRRSASQMCRADRFCSEFYDISTNSTPPDDKYRVTRKAIPRLTSYINIKRHDLYLDDERQLYADFPNYNSDLASVKIPSLPYWSRLLLGNYQDLYIVSPETSPASSQAGSETQRTSPTASWGTDSQESAEREARLDAVREREGEDSEEDGKK